MRYRVVGDGKRRILVVHGWGHSSLRWLKFSRAFAAKGYTVYSVDLPGFGKTPPLMGYDGLLIDNIGKHLARFIEDHGPFDYYIGHSLGARLLYQLSLENRILKSKKLILCNMPIIGIRFLRLPSQAIIHNKVMFYLAKLIPFFIIYPYMKMYGGLTVRKRKYVDPIMVKDIRMSDPTTLSVLLKELAHDHWNPFRVKPRLDHVVLINSRYDRLVHYRKSAKLSQICKMRRYELKYVAHTPVVECFEDYCYLIEEIIST